MISENKAFEIARSACQQYDIFWDTETASAGLAKYQGRVVWHVGTGFPRVHWTEQKTDEFPELVVIDAETGEFLGRRTMRGLTPPAHLQQRKEERLAKDRKESKVNAS